MSAAGPDGIQGCRVLAIMGSGETSPTMVAVHKALAAMLGSAQPRAVLLDTPYAFQENAAEVSAKARAYFARSVGLDVTVVSGPGGPDDADGADSADGADGAGPGGRTGDSEAAAIRTADWLFSGPGSPSYALTRWQATGAGAALRERVAGGSGVTVLASAAAATAGLAAVPVYEIYKAGAQPHWLDGLDLTGMIGLNVAVIPHFNNSEGGTHDTRYCYLGERRLARMERELPAGSAVLGVDEHTAAVLDLRAQTLAVTGRGGVTVRRPGSASFVGSGRRGGAGFAGSGRRGGAGFAGSGRRPDAVVLPAGTVIPLDRLRALIAGEPAGSGPADSPAAGREPGGPDPAPAEAGLGGPAPLPLPELSRDCEQRFDRAAAGRDGPGMVSAILDLEEAIHAWAADTDEDQGTAQARAVLRALLTRLGVIARDGLRAPADLLRPAVAPLLDLRTALREAGRYPDADAIRDALVAAGLIIRDTPGGTRWRQAGGPG